MAPSEVVDETEPIRPRAAAACVRCHRPTRGASSTSPRIELIALPGCPPSCGPMVCRACHEAVCSLLHIEASRLGLVLEPRSVSLLHCPACKQEYTRSLLAA